VGDKVIKRAAGANLTTAKALGSRRALALQQLADEVIE
jgi:hypothetical protein